MLRTYGLDLEVVESKFYALKNDIKLVFFMRETGCAHCAETRKLLEELASVTHKIDVDFYNFAIDQEKDREYHVFAIPALAIIGEKDYGIRYYGYPHGTEVNDFLDDIIYVSKGESTLSPEARKNLSQLTKPTQLKLFVSPDCPYSLPVAKLSIKLAIASDMIAVDIIHADEFLQLAETYNVRGIPVTVVNDKNSFYGALDEMEYVHRIIELS